LHLIELIDASHAAGMTRGVGVFRRRGGSRSKVSRLNRQVAYIRNGGLQLQLRVSLLIIALLILEDPSDAIARSSWLLIRAVRERRWVPPRPIEDEEEVSIDQVAPKLRLRRARGRGGAG